MIYIKNVGQMHENIRIIINTEQKRVEINLL